MAIVRTTLLHLGFPLREVQKYTDTVRREHYDVEINSQTEHRVLQQLIDAADAIEITWIDLPDDSPVIGQTLAQADLRSQTGASVVALFRDEELLPNPKSMTIFQAGDRIGVIGEAEQIAAAEQLLGVASDRERALLST